jgi:hypothetical protein
VRVVTANNTTLVDKNALNFGSYNSAGGYTSHIAGALNVTAGGDISQAQSSNSDGYSAIEVDGTATFTANNASAPISLYLGSGSAFNGTGQANNFVGGVTLARNNTNTGFTNVQLRNVNPTASVLTGMTLVGPLNNVFLRFDSVPSVSLPEMTLTGNLSVAAPSVANSATVPGNVISQTGPIVVAGSTVVQAAATGDIVLVDPANDFNQFGIIASRNTTVVDANALVLTAPGLGQSVSGNLTVNTSGPISDAGFGLSVAGIATFNAGLANDVSLLQNDTWNVVAVQAANNVTLNPWTGVILDNSTIAGTLSITSHNTGYTLTQIASSAVNMTGAGITTFVNFTGGITLAETGNVFGPLTIANGGAVNLRENDAITQSSAWTNANGSGVGYPVTLTTSNNQAITLDQAGNYLGPLTITQVNVNAPTAGAVYVRETADGLNGMTQGGAWSVNGTTRLDSGTYSMTLNNPNNVFGPLQVSGGTGTTTGVPSSVTLYARNTATANAISDVGGTGPWATGTGVVKLIAYDVTGTIAGGGNINLTNPGNVLGDLYIKAVNATITESDNITDGVSASWDAAGDTGWVTTGTTNLVVANPAGKSITLDNLSNQLGPVGINTTGTAGALSAVLITDNSNLTQGSVWNVGTTPVTLDSRTNQIDLSTFGNVLGDININTSNGTPTAVAITENANITQGSAWILPGVPVTLLTQTQQAITLTNASNLMGNLTVSAGAVSITENGGIRQGGAWTTTGTTTLSPTGGPIALANAGNILGPLLIAGTPTSVTITENDDITQAAEWVQPGVPVTLNAGTHDVLLSAPLNQLGDLTLTAQNATITESGASGITDGGAWRIPGTTTLTAGNANPIVLNANPGSDFGTVSIVSASNADIADINGIVLGTSAIASGGFLTVSAGGAITQSGAITAPSLRLIGTGNATLTNTANNVNNLSAGFTGGDLTFTNSGSFAITVAGGTSGITIGANNVTLASVSGTVTGLSNINPSSSSLSLSAGTGLSLPQMTMAGPQTYTAGGSGITLNAGITGTAAGTITFNSPTTLAADLIVQSADSHVVFNSTLAGGTNQLTVTAGTGLVRFFGAVSALGNINDAGAALSLSSGGATFYSTLGANNGLAVSGPVVFGDTVTLADGNAPSVFTGLVTLGKAGGMNLSGYDGMTFNGGLLLQNGAATINSNNSALAFQTAGSVSGPYGLTLNSGTQSLIGLNRMGTDLTSLSVTALNPTIPAGGVSIAGPQTYTATAGSNIGLAGNLISTASGAITFNSPVTVSASSSVTTSDSPIFFGGTVDGSHNLTVSSGTALKTFTAAVGSVASLGDGLGASLILRGTGATAFSADVQARSGVTAQGPVTLNGNLTLGNGDTGSDFTGLVTVGGTGATISGFDGIAFDGGLALAGGPVSVITNGGVLSFGGPVTGPQNLTLNALAAGVGTVVGLNQIGSASNLTGLSVTAQTLSLPSAGLAVNGPMSFSAAGGITVNGAVGNNTTGTTGQIDFNGAVSLASGPITISTLNSPVNFNSTVNGAEPLTIDSGTGAMTFGAAVGATTALTSVTTSTGGSTSINGGSVQTVGAQTYRNPVGLGANTTLTGVNVQFGATLDGAHALTVNDSGTTTFSGLVGSTTPLTSITTDAPGAVAVNTTAVTTSAAQTYSGNLVLGADTTLTGLGISFNGTVDGAYNLTADAGSAALRFGSAVGSLTPPTSLTARGNTIAAGSVSSTGAQDYTANALTLNGTLSTSGADITVAGPTTLGGDVTLQTGGGDISFRGGTSTINGAHFLTLTAGAGNVVLGGVVGGVSPLIGLTVSGYDLTLPAINTVNDANQSYTALDNITLNQSRNINAPVTFTADADNNGSGSFILLNGVSLTASNNTLTIRAADVDLQGNSTLSSGSGLMTLTATDGGNILLGGPDVATPGQMTISGTELSRMSSSTGLDLDTTGAGWVHATGVLAAQSQNITGTLLLNAQGTGDVSFVTSPSTFNAVKAQANGGTINVGVDLTTTNDSIEFATPVSVSGASTINSGGGNINFDGTVAVNNDLTLTTGNGILTFSNAVGSNKTLTLNLGGGSVAGLGQLQSVLTGLTVNSTSGITLPALTINGPQLYNTGTITVTGDLGGVGITFNNFANVSPASGTALTMNAGAGTLAFNGPVSFSANNVTLTADEIQFTHAVTGSGSLLMQPFTSSRNIAVGGSTTPLTSLNLTATDLAWLPIGTLTGLTIGSASGTGALDIAGTFSAPGTPLTLNGGGGITQGGGSLTSGSLSLYAAGNAITLANAANAFGAVAIAGTPSALSLVNTLDIDQLGTAPWNVGTAPVTLSAGTHDIVLNNVGNSFGTLALQGGEVQVTEAAATDIGASAMAKNLTVASSAGVNFSGALAVTGNVSVASAGVVTQSAPLTVGGNLVVSTTVNAGDVTLDNSGAPATTIGNTQIGGSYVLTATGKPVSQAPGTSLQVRGNLTITGSNIVLAGAGNLVGGVTSLPATNTVEVRQSGVINLGTRSDTGSLTVVSERTSRSFTGAQVTGNAVVLNNPANSISGNIAVTASPAAIMAGPDVPTGINQLAGTSISVAGLASFTAEPSSAGSTGINLTNSGNSFGAIQLSGNVVAVNNSAAGPMTVATALATTSLALVTAGAVAQTGALNTPALSVNAGGGVTLNNAANDVNSLTVVSGGPVSYVDANSVDLAGINASGANVSVTAGSGGNVTQSAALLNVGALSANAGGTVILTNAGNTIASLAPSLAGTGVQIFDSAGGLNVTGLVRTSAGDMSIRTSGDLTLSGSGRLEADAGNLVASTEGAGNFINNAGTSALAVGSGKRWLVYSDTPDLVSGPHTQKGGLTSSFRHFGAVYGSYAPGTVSEAGNGFIYKDPAATLTITATVIGTPSQVYGDTPTGTLSYGVGAGFLDSEDTAANIITGGAATYSTALANTLNAGVYNIKYTGGLTSNYNLVANTTGVVYTVTPAVLTYTANAASRAFGVPNPVLSGSISGFKLAQNTSVLGGSATWSTTAVPASNAGSYAINGSGYTTGGNYTFAQALSNATAFTIGKAGLIVTANGAGKTYDATPYSGGAGVTFSGFANGDNPSILGGSVSYGGSAQGARNVGSYTITPSGFSSGNYTIVYVDGALVIGRAPVTLTSSSVSRTYDGTLAALGTASVTAGTHLLGTDTLSGGTFSFTNANSGIGNKVVTTSAVTLNDGNNGGNYDVTYVNNTTSTINPEQLTVAAANLTKTYDSTLAATDSATVVAGTLFQNASNSNAQDVLSGGNFAFTNPDAGAGNKTVTASNVSVTDGNGGSNYILSYVNNTASTIDRASLTYLGTVSDKTYDGTRAATVSGYTLTGFVGSQTLRATAGSATFADKDAAIGKNVTLGSITLANGLNGGLATNYVVSPTATAIATIDPKILAVNAVVANKVYDGTTNAILQSYGLSGFIGTETVTGINTGTASFVDKNVGTDKAVAITGINLVDGINGGLANNYVVSNTATSTGNIVPAPLHIAGVIALDKVYDGTVTAKLNTQAAVLTGIFGTDSVQVGSITGTYATKDVGPNRLLGTGTVVLTGAEAGDYTLIQPAGLSASITPRSLTVAATGVDKVYDGSANATVNLTDNRISGDHLTIASVESFADKSAGTGKYVRVSNIAISGADAEDYTVNSSADASANISKANLTVTAGGGAKVYDSTTAAIVTLTGAPLSGDSVNVTYANAAYGDKNVGKGKTITVNGIAISGADAGDYNSVLSTTTTGDVTPATLTVGAIGHTKPFDGTTSAIVTLTDNRFRGDQLTFGTPAANYANSLVGTDQTIAVGGIEIVGGADRGNYVLASNTATTTGGIAGSAAPELMGTWSLAPALPQPSSPTVPAPPTVPDLTIPADPTDSSDSNVAAYQSQSHALLGTNSISIPFGAYSGDQVAVTLIRPASARLPGMVSVTVPGDMISLGEQITIALPGDLIGAAGDMKITLTNGKRLPSWLRYVPSKRAFVISAMPAGALPIDVLIRVGTQRWTMPITEHATR